MSRIDPDASVPHTEDMNSLLLLLVTLLAVLLACTSCKRGGFGVGSPAFQQSSFEIFSAEKEAEGYLKYLTPPEGLAVFLSIRALCPRDQDRMSAAEALTEHHEFPGVHGTFEVPHSPITQLSQ